MESDGSLTAPRCNFGASLTAAFWQHCRWTTGHLATCAEGQDAIGLPRHSLAAIPHRAARDILTSIQPARRDARADARPATVPDDQLHWKLNAGPAARPGVSIRHYVLPSAN